MRLSCNYPYLRSFKMGYTRGTLFSLIPPIPRRNRMVDDAQIPLDRLPPNIQTLAIVCPLCSAQVPIRGLRERPTIEGSNAHWQMVFTCPTCGLVTTFRADQTSARQLPVSHGSAWAGSLRHFRQAQKREHLRERGPASR